MANIAIQKEEICGLGAVKWTVSSYILKTEGADPYEIMVKICQITRHGLIVQ